MVISTLQYDILSRVRCRIVCATDV